MWYKRYIQSKSEGKNIEKFFQLSSERNMFWEKIRKEFHLTKDVQVYVSDSHMLSYKVAKDNIELFKNNQLGENQTKYALYKSNV